MYSYPEAVNHAANIVITDQAVTRTSRLARLRELLYSLANSIPESWYTESRPVLTRREHSIDYIIEALTIDMYENEDLTRYQILSSILLVALTIKQMSGVTA
jgi:hypothetical protein